MCECDDNFFPELHIPNKCNVSHYSLFISFIPAQSETGHLCETHGLSVWLETPRSDGPHAYAPLPNRTHAWLRPDQQISVHIQMHSNLSGSNCRVSSLATLKWARSTVKTCLLCFCLLKIKKCSQQDSHLLVACKLLSHLANWQRLFGVLVACLASSSLWISVPRKVSGSKVQMQQSWH